jgi:hypothetical protein
MATATQITLDAPPQPTSPPGVSNILQFEPNTHDRGFQLLYDQEWRQDNFNPQKFDLIQTYRADTPTTPAAWFTQTPISPTLNGTEPWLIATAAASAVPEPSTAVLAVLGAVTGIAYGWSRHRRAQRRLAAA